jgi:hypothetical protein
LFSNALNLAKEKFGGQKKQPVQEADTNMLQKAYSMFYGNKNKDENSLQGATTKMMGAAAAMQVMKMFASGGNDGGSSNGLMGKAMGEAVKLYLQHGSQVSGSKEDAVSSAALTIGQLLASGGGDKKNSGGDIQGMIVQNLMSKFM